MCVCVYVVKWTLRVCFINIICAILFLYQLFIHSSATIQNAMLSISYHIPYRHTACVSNHCYSLLYLLNSCMLFDRFLHEITSHTFCFFRLFSMFHNIFFLFLPVISTLNVQCPICHHHWETVSIGS